MAVIFAVIGPPAIEYSQALAAPVQQARWPVSIDRAPLGNALLQLAKQVSLQIVRYADDSSAQVTVGPASGFYTRDEALGLLLRDTGFTYRYVDDHTVAIVRAGDSAAHSQDQSGAPSTNPVSALGNTDSTGSVDNPGSKDVSGNTEKSQHRSIWSRIVGLFSWTGEAAPQRPSVTMRRALTSATLSLMIGATATHAQTPDPTASGPEIAEIIVTATRQEQNLQKVSAAVSVIDGGEITNQGLANLQQIFADLPSVQTTGQPGGASIDIRGLGGDLPAGSTQGSVALVFDGVYNINSQGTTVGFFDVNRIEVLPGPQSTRFGPDADGGVVQVISNDPVLGQFGGQQPLRPAITRWSGRKRH